MWRTRRQTKKHKTKNKPKVLLQTVYCVVGVAAFGFIIYALSSLLRQDTLVVPVVLTQSVKGVASMFSAGDAGEVERLLKEKKISFLFVTTSKDAAYVVTLPDNAEVLLAKENIPTQIASLQHITSRLTMEGKRFTRLDLRFDRPVIVLK